MNIYISEFLFNNKERLWDEIFTEFIEGHYNTSDHSVKEITGFKNNIELFALVVTIQVSKNEWDERTFGFIERTDDYMKLQMLSGDEQEQDRAMDFIKGLENSLPRDILIDNVLD